MMRKIMLAYFLLISMDSPAQRVITLEEAIATAMKNNFDILLAKNDSMAAAIDY